MHDIISYDVFISHSLKDEKWVSDFALHLSNWGLSVFIFEKDIKVGESIPLKITKVLEECNFLILIMTEDWVASEWSKLEVYSALFNDPHNSKLKVIPVFLKECKIPITLKILKYLDFRDKGKLKENLKLLQFVLIDIIQYKFINQIHSIQSNQILSQSMLPWTNHGGPSVGFIIPELYIEPKIKPIKNPLASTRFNNWLINYKWNKNIVIVGLPGIGKSTLLKKLYIDYNKYLNIFKLDFIPVFSTVRDLIEFKNSKFKNYFEFISRKLDLKSPNYPTRKFLYLIDGIDEIGESSSNEIIEILIKIITDKDLIWISSRKDFFFNHLKTNSKFFSLFYDILEIQEWNIEEDSLKFIMDYSIKYNDPEIYNRLIFLRCKSPKIDNFLKKPFELTLILYLLTSIERISLNTFNDSYTLYKSFYDNWIERERNRGTSKLTANEVCVLHRSIAIRLFQNKGNGINLNNRDLDALNINTSLANIKMDSSFWELLITSKKDNDDIIERFWHETLGEFILAEELIQSFCSANQSFVDSLKNIYNNEINQFIREGFQQLNKYQKQFVYKKLADTYFTQFSIKNHLDYESINIDVLSSLEITDEHINNSYLSVRIREQIIYYLGRLELDFYPPILSFAVKFEKNLLLKRSAILGGILHRNEVLEKQYIGSLITGSIEDKLNRSVQLVYFGDSNGDIHTFKDNDLFPWEKTRMAILSRLKQNSDRDIALRWWDLKTLYCFFDSRKWNDKISKIDYTIIENCICNSLLFSKNRNNEVTNEVSIILTSIQNNNCIIDS